MTLLPKEILATAFKAHNGEYGWKTQHIVPALRAVVESGQAIVGGNAWTVKNNQVVDLFPSSQSYLGFKMWDTGHRTSDESWIEYCQRTLDESIQEINNIVLEVLVSVEQRDLFFINPTYCEEFDARLLVPRHKHDHERASAAIAAGYPAVAPIMYELLEWLQDMNWPVAQDLAPFLADIGDPLIPHIRKIFETDDQMWKYWIIGAIMHYSKSVAEEFREELNRIAYSPTDQEFEENLPEQALSVLEEYGWAK